VTTTVTLTGTGVPHPSPGRAGAGVLVRSGDVALQFDAGRGTVIRLAEAGIAPHQLSAVFLTHVHSDHVVDLADVAMTRWIQQTMHPSGPLEIVCPTGGPERFARRMLEPFDEDIEIRMHHVQETPPRVEIRSFDAPSTPTVVWTSTDGSVRVTAVAVHHEPVRDAVAYRIDTPDGAVVISGDTRVCKEVEDLSRGAAVLVHEICRTRAMSSAVVGTAFEKIFDYHSDSVALGEMAERSGVPHLVLTHLIPQPRSDRDIESFSRDVRDGGYTGQVTVGRDLESFVIG
jgi:ribonuclease Z